MKYNAKGIDKLVASFGMQFEIESLRGAGLTYEKLAEALDEIFNPESKFCNANVKELFIGINRGKQRLGSEGYERAKIYFGIGTSQEHNLKSVAELNGLSNAGVTHYVNIMRFISPNLVRNRPICNYFFDFDNPARGKLKRQIYQRALEKVMEL